MKRIEVRTPYQASSQRYRYNRAPPQWQSRDTCRDSTTKILFLSILIVRRVGNVAQQHCTCLQGQGPELDSRYKNK